MTRRFIDVVVKISKTISISHVMRARDRGWSKKILFETNKILNALNLTKEIVL